MKRLLLRPLSTGSLAIILAEAVSVRRITQREVAQRLAKSEGRVSQILSGEAPLNESTFWEWLDALDLDLEVELRLREPVPLDIANLEEALGALERGDGAMAHQLRLVISEAVRELLRQRKEASS